MLAELVAFAFAESVVVTAARLPQSPEELVRPVTVITAEDIARAGQQSLVDILQTLGNVEVSRNGGYGQLSGIFIRGANSNHTLVLVDGMRVSAATSGATAFEHIPVNLIERIEIVPGPASALYGSDAIGGVVQIFTKGAAPSLAAAAGAGSYATRSVRASAGSLMGATTFSLQAGHFVTRGFSATRLTIPFGQFDPDDDGYRNWNVSAKVAHRIAERHELGASFTHSEGRTWFDSGPGDAVSDERLETATVYSRNRFTAGWESVLRLGYGRDELDIRSSFPSAFDTKQPQATWQNTVAVPHGHVIAGAEYLEQRLGTTRDFARKSRRIASYFAGYHAAFGTHGLQLNGRHDDNEQFGGHSTGNIAYAYRLGSLRLRAGAGNAFKAPTFNDLYFPGFSNPDLDPERSRNREGGLDWTHGNHGASLSYFDNRVADLIVFDGATGRPQNVSRARIRGTEISYRFEAGAFRADVRATAQRPLNDDTGKLLQRRAKRHGSARAGYRLGGWTLGAEMVGSSERFDSATESPATRLAGYAIVNVTIARDLGGGWTARLRWDNVADRRYEIAQHYNTPGSNAFLEIAFSR